MRRRRSIVLLALLSACGPQREASPPTPTPAADAPAAPPPELDAGAATGPTLEPEVVPNDGTWPLSCPASCNGRLRARSAEQARRQLAGVRACYDRQLQTAPGAEGRITLEMLVREGSGVCAARAVDTTFDAPSLAGCLLRVLQDAGFEAAHGCVVLRQTLVFRPSPR